MKKLKFTPIFFVLMIFLAACSDDEDDIDQTNPTIDFDFESSFPKPCVVVQRGTTFNFHAKFSDNDVLGSYAIDIHNNFDHHTHDNYDVQCDLSPIKAPVNPFIYIQNFTIEGDLKEYQPTLEIVIPDAIDVGDYHFEVRLTDKTGWQTRHAIDFKIAD
ncbi:DUF4625 domain-containing protein [Aureivirga sp. CE67]|uniref:DUF4625 domain-containing protein n=1 Tax=Aureivirga sp. CE67 TaxID=1788983 RepID=UPI0018C96BAB|nr:DUF4625 domain-containing protein [Aureivirga sp. CE67]